MSSVGGRLGHLRPRGGSKKEGKVGPLVCFPWGPSGLHGRVPVPSCLPVHPSGPLSFPHPLPPGSHTHQFPFCFRMPPTPRASHPNTDRLPLPLATFSFASLSGSWPPFMSPFGSVSLGPLSPFWLSTCVSPSLPASLCGASVSEALSLLCLSAISLSLCGSLSPVVCLSSLCGSLSLSVISLLFSVSLLLSLPLPPHILSCLWGTGNLGDQRDTGRLGCCHRLEIMRGGGLGLDGGGGAQNPLRLPRTLCVAHTETEELCPLFGPQCPLLWTGPDERAPSQAWCESPPSNLTRVGGSGSLGMRDRREDTCRGVRG